MFCLNVQYYSYYISVVYHYYFLISISIIAVFSLLLLRSVYYLISHWCCLKTIRACVRGVSGPYKC